MQISPEKVGSLLGLLHDKKRSILWGKMEQYPLYLQWFPNNLTFAVHIYAKAPAGTDARSLLREFDSQHPCMNRIRQRQYAVTALLTLEPKQTAEHAAAEIRALMQMIMANGFLPCCSECGAETDARMFRVNADGLHLCSACQTVVQQEIGNINRQLDTHKPHNLKAVLGCLLGAAAAFLLQAFLSDAGTMPMTAVLYTFCGIALSLIFVKRRAGWASKWIAVCSTLCCIAGAVFGIVYWHAAYFADYNQGQKDYCELILAYYDAYQSDADIYEWVFHVDDERLYHLMTLEESELQSYYESAQIVTSHQTVTRCLADIVSLMRSHYGNKVRGNFISALTEILMSGLVMGWYFWVRVCRADSLRYQMAQLPDTAV